MKVLTLQKKQSFYKEARAPVKYLRAELSQMKQVLQAIDTESKNGRAVRLFKNYIL